jgi:hypothetical protein
MSLFNPDIQRVLDGLKRRIRRYLLIEGLSQVLIVLAILFVVSFAIDVGYFRISRLELPGWFRRGFLIVMAATLAGTLISWVVLRLTQRIRGKALALVLERRFKHLNDRLITAVELADEPEDSESLKSAMARRTVMDAGEQIRSLDLDQVFDNRRLRRVIVIASMLIAGIVGFGLINAAGMQRWANAYLLGHDNYWDPFRKSSLTVRVLAQPGDRMREFSSDGVYRHPRGADLTLIIESTADAQTPESVTVYSRCYASTGTRTEDGRAARVRQNEYRFTIQRVTDNHDLSIIGGDYRNRTPFKIEVVDPPRIAEVRLECDYPEYIGREAEEDKPVVVQGAQVTLPMETEFHFVGSVNKPLRGFQVRSPAMDLEFGVPAGARIGDAPLTATLVIRGEEGESATVVELPPEQTKDWFSSDRLSFSVPFHLGLGSTEALAAAASEGSARVPIPLPPDLPLQITLEDDDEIFSQEPSRLTIRGEIDQPPVIETQRTGVSGSITRMATVPITGKVTDDYGVALTEFAFRAEAEAEFAQSQMSRTADGATEFDLRTSDEEPYEKFDVLPLELREGNTLTLTVVAEDGDNINGPHRSQGELYEFVIVPPEEILALLAEKELNLRQRLEQIQRELQSVQVMLLDARAQVAERESVIAQGGSAVDIDRLSGLIESAQERSISDVHQNHTETRTIELLMQEIRAEMINNRIDSVEMLDRIDRGILAPLHVINEQDFPELDEALALFGLLNQSRANPIEHIDAADLALNRLLDHIQGVLEEMSRRENYAELVENLTRMIELQRAILEESREEQTRDLFESTE